MATRLFGLPLGYAISKQALVGATTSAHAAKSFDRREIHRHYPDGAIVFHDPFQPLGWTEGERARIGAGITVWPWAVMVLRMA